MNMKKLIAVAAVAASAMAAAGARPAFKGEFMCGVNFGFYAREGYYESQAARDEVDEMAKTGVKWVTVIATVYQETWCSTLQYRDFADSPGDLELADIIDYIHSKGMKVCLRPMEESLDGLDRLSIRFPADCERMPGRRVSHASKWFDSMRKRSRYYAKIAARTKCEAFCLDSEIDRLMNFDKEWRSVIAAVREVYKGPVTSCHTMVAGDALMKRGNWLSELDFISISNYPSPHTQPGAGKEAMMKGLQGHLAHMRKIAAATGKKILFGEIGCTSTHGASKAPAGWSGNGGYDGKEQADYMDAFFTLFEKEPWCIGFMWWKWDEQNNRPQFKDDPKGDKGFTIRGKPAQEVMRRHYKGIQ